MGKLFLYEGNEKNKSANSRYSLHDGQETGASKSGLNA